MFETGFRDNDKDGSEHQEWTPTWQGPTWIVEHDKNSKGGRRGNALGSNYEASQAQQHEAFPHAWSPGGLHEQKTSTAVVAVHAEAETST